MKYILLFSSLLLAGCLAPRQRMGTSNGDTITFADTPVQTGVSRAAEFGEVTGIYVPDGTNVVVLDIPITISW